MSHEIFLVYAREDAAFAKILAKGMERYNISVLYKDSLASTRCFKTAIVEGFREATFGLVVISKAMFKLEFDEGDLDYLYDTLLLDEQILHPVWYRVNEEDVCHWFPKLTGCPALHSPPETADSIARKFQMKLAGSSHLQQNTLNGVHPQIQYIPPHIGTYRASQQRATNGGIPTDEKAPISNQDLEQHLDPEIESVAEDIELEEKDQSPEKEEKADISYLSIKDCFDLTTRDQISRRLDVYLKGLSNWQDFARQFSVTDAKKLKALADTKAPSMNLLDIIAYKDVTIGEFKNACRNINRNDIAEYVNKRMAELEL